MKETLRQTINKIQPSASLHFTSQGNLEFTEYAWNKYVYMK